MIGGETKNARFNPFENVSGIGDGGGAVVAGADGRIRNAIRFRAPAIPTGTIGASLGAQSLGSDDCARDGFSGGIHHADEGNGMTGRCEAQPDEHQRNDTNHRREHDQSSDAGFPHFAPLVWCEVRQRRCARQLRVGADFKMSRKEHKGSEGKNFARLRHLPAMEQSGE